MGITLDAQIVKDKLNNLFRIGHEHTDFVHRLHEQHAPDDTEWKRAGPVMMHHVDEKTKLVRFEFDNMFDAPTDNKEQKLEERLRYIERFLAAMVGPGEEYHLTIEERPHVTDKEHPNRVTYFARGVVVPKA